MSLLLTNIAERLLAGERIVVAGKYRSGRTAILTRIAKALNDRGVPFAFVAPYGLPDVVRDMPHRVSEGYRVCLSDDAQYDGSTPSISVLDITAAGGIRDARTIYIEAPTSLPSVVHEYMYENINNGTLLYASNADALNLIRAGGGSHSIAVIIDGQNPDRSLHALMDVVRGRVAVVMHGQARCDLSMLLASHDIITGGDVIDTVRRHAAVLRDIPEVRDLLQKGDLPHPVTRSSLYDTITEIAYAKVSEWRQRMEAQSLSYTRFIQMLRYAFSDKSYPTRIHVLTPADLHGKSFDYIITDVKDARHIRPIVAHANLHTLVLTDSPNEYEAPGIHIDAIRDLFTL